MNINNTCLKDFNEEAFVKSIRSEGVDAAIMVLDYLKEYPDKTDTEVSAIFDIDPSAVEILRNFLTGKNDMY